VVLVLAVATLFGCGRIGYGATSNRDAAVGPDTDAGREGSDGGGDADGDVPGMDGDTPGPDAASDASLDAGPPDDDSGVVSRDGLVAWYPMDDPASGGTVEEASGNDNHATCTECPAATGGRFGGALRFSAGAHLQVDTPDGFDPTRGLTVALWARPSATPPDYAALVAHPVSPSPGDLSWALHQWGDDRATFETTGPSSTQILPSSPGAVGPGAWTHVAGTWEPGCERKRLFVNGVEVNAGNEPIVSGGGAIFVDDRRIYDRALPDAAIAAMAGL